MVIDPSSLQLTYGFDLELVAKMVTALFNRHRAAFVERHNGRNFSQVFNATSPVFRDCVRLQLMSVGVPVHPIFTPEYTTVGSATPRRISPGTCAGEHFSRWHVVKDTSVDDDSELVELSVEHGSIELVSRILQRGNKDDDEEVTRALGAVLSNPSPQCPLMLFIERTTGLHCHVGVAIGWRIPALRRLALLVVAFEHLIHQLLPWSRLDPENPNTVWHQPPSLLFPQMRHCLRISRVRLCCKRRELTRVMGAGKSAAYYMRAIKDSQSTVEFRQFPATLDQGEIRAYIDVALALAGAAHWSD